jgi:branched-chain amino acid transport system substrate-binding protein
MILDCTSAPYAAEKQMRHGNRMAVLVGSALMLSASVALGQVKTTNQGISDTEVLVGTHQVLTGPGSAWGVPVSYGMKMAVEEINAAGGVNGRKLKLIIEDSGYDPKRAVLATQKLID